MRTDGTNDLSLHTFGHGTALLVAFPIIVWGADETRRGLIRRHDRRHLANLGLPGRIIVPAA